MKSITLFKPDDWHLHFRDASFLSRTVPDTAHQFGRAIVMPNLSPPIRTTEEAEMYLQRINKHIPDNNNFEALMTLYLTDNTTADMIRTAAASKCVYAAKLYPAGATTNSDFGVTHVDKLNATFEAMQQVGLPLLVHGESTDPNDDIFDREKIFIDQTLTPLRQKFPDLKIIFEHITTKDAVEYVSQAGELTAATITPQHLLINRNALFTGGIRPHHYCLPVVKREEHRLALNKVALSGHPQFFAGTDSAPHTSDKKESACGCAGIYSSNHAIELYAEAFERNYDFTHFEAFMSTNGAHFYGLEPHTDRITLNNSPWQVADSLSYGDPKDNQQLIPFMAGETLQWKLQGTTHD